MPREALWLAPQDRIKVLASLGALAGVLVLIFAFIAVFTAFTYPTDTGPLSHVYMGTIDQFEVGKPVEYEPGDFYLVKKPAGTFIALYPKDNHPAGCNLRWMEDFVFSDRDGRQRVGWFRDECTHNTFDVYGARVFGPAPRGLDQFPVEVKGNKVYVRAVERLLIRGKSAFGVPAR